MAISISAVKRKDRNTVESSSAWPDASNTGPSGTLTNSGSLTITTPGTTVQDLNITGGIEVQAANVTIRNCSINGPAYFVIDLYASADTVLIEDCYIAGGVNAGILFEDGCSNVTVRRCEFTGNEDGMKGSGSYITIQDCYIHDPLVQGGIRITTGSKSRVRTTS